MGVLQSWRWLLFIPLFSYCGVPGIGVVTGTGGIEEDVSIGTVIPKEYFGLHIHHATDGTDWPRVEFGAWRLWDSGVAWAQIQPRREQWDFSRLDADVALAELHRTDLVLTLAMTPQWASARPDEDSAYGPGNSAEPAELSDWIAYATTMATRYRGRIRYYEIWNEPNLKMYFTGSSQKLLVLGCTAYRAIKAVDPDARVISPGFTVWDTTWMETYFAAGGGACTDIVGYHFYSWPHEPEFMIPLFERVRGIATKYGLSDRPLWNTEGGWFIEARQREVVSQGWNAVISYEVAANYVARAFLLHYANGISRYYLYGWDDRDTGLCEVDGVTLKPSVAVAYGEVERWLAGATFLGCRTDLDKTFVCRVARENGYRGFIAWNPESRIQSSAFRAWGASRYRLLDGTSIAIEDAATVEIGPAPILFEAAAIN